MLLSWEVHIAGRWVQWSIKMELVIEQTVQLEQEMDIVLHVHYDEIAEYREMMS